MYNKLKTINLINEFRFCKCKCLFKNNNIMNTARLELISFEILRPKERWNIYFILATEHPEDKNKFILTVVPDTGIIPLRNLADNNFSFKPKGEGADGFCVIENLTNIVSKSPQWILIDKGFDFIQNILKNTKDRNLGFVSLDDDFGKEFDKNPYQERSNTLSTGNAKITWAWSIR